jgi:pentatricopeptide repeat protein
MQRRLVKPDLVVYTIIINGMCRSRKVKDAKEVLSRLIVEGLKPDVHTYTALVDGLCREGSIIEALRLFRKMEEDGCMPGSCSYNVLLQGCLQHNDTSTVVQLIHEMADRGFYADAVTRTFLKDFLPGNDSPAIKQLLGLFEGHQGVKVK